MEFNVGLPGCQSPMTITTVQVLFLTELRVSDTLVRNFLHWELSPVCALTISHGVDMADLGDLAPMAEASFPTRVFLLGI